jgi:hypothetical protein
MNEERDPEYWYAKAEKDGTLAPQRGRLCPGPASTQARLPGSG